MVYCACLFWCTGGWLAPAVQAAPSSAEVLDLLLLFRNNTAELNSLTADFRQEKRLELLAETLVSGGRLCMRQTPEGEMLLWEYTTPNVSGFIYENGENGQTQNQTRNKMRVWMRDRQSMRPATSQETKALGAMSTHVLTWMHADPDRLTKLYELALLPADDRTPEQTNEALPAGIRLVPRKANPFFSAIEVRFNPDMKSLYSLRLVEPHGDTTLLRFTNVTPNALPAFCQP